MTGRTYTTLRSGLALLGLLSLTSLLTGCSHDEDSAAKGTTTPAPGKGTAANSPAPAASSGDTKALTDQQKTMQIENGDGGKAPQ